MVHHLSFGGRVSFAIVQWALENLRIDTMPVFLNPQPDGNRLYQK